MATNVFRTGWLLMLALASLGAGAQTFEINSSQNNPQPQQKKNKQTPQTRTAQSTGTRRQSAAPENGIGWGSGIEVARQARSAQQALEKGNYNDAVLFATRAANAAPQDTALWFTLGYAARLAGQYQTSINAYKRGLSNQPSSIAGLSGLAQTYAKVGRTQDAQDLLKQVLAANPRSATDLQLAGELSLNSDAKSALDLLKRAESIQPSSRNELLIARAYQRLDQPADAKIYLERAVGRSPNDVSVLRALGAFYRDDKRYDQAIAALQKAAASNDLQARAELAYTYQLAGKKAEAAQTYSAAADKAPGDAGLQLSAAQALVNVGEFGRADSYLARAAAKDANNYRLHAIRGQVAALQNQTDDAIREYRAAIQNLPEAVPEGPLYPVQLHLGLYELYRNTDQEQASAAELAAAKNEIAGVQGQDHQPEYLRLRALVEAAGNDTAAAEKDFKLALSLDPKNPTIMLNYANLLLKTDRKQDAYQMYQQAIAIDPNNGAGLTALGYLARELADARTAEKYFQRVLTLYPKDYVPYLALGDLYTAQREFPQAQAMYEKAHELAPNNPLVFAGGVNAGIEGHQLPVSKHWIDRAMDQANIAGNPVFMREEERYLTLTGQYQASADLGYKVIEKLPHDPEAPVYLAYDLLFLGKFQESFEIVQRFEPVLPKDKDLRLIAGYDHAHYGQLREAYSDFTRAIQLDPKVSTAYMNRGWVLNDLQRPELAAKDFETALQLRPNYGEAHLGLAFANLQLHRAKPALQEADLAAGLMGESKATHLARAEAYRQQVKYPQAEQSYRLALTFAPDDIPTHLALADTLYRERRYEDAVQILKSIAGKSEDGLVYAELAKAYAQIHDEADARQAIASAEKAGGDDTRVLLATGDALLLLGDSPGAMELYGKALQVPGADRVQTRLALARLFAQRGRKDDAEQQIGLAFSEAQVGQGSGISAEDYLDAAGVLMTINQYELAKSYFRRAQAAGAGDEAVSLGLANAYLALGQTQDAGNTLNTLASTADYSDNYDYLIARSNVYRQRQDITAALADLARANRLVEGNDYSERAELALAGEEGAQINQTVSYQPLASFAPIFEDINLYTLDAKLRGITSPSLLPPPRYQYESIGGTRWRLKFNGLPPITALVEERNANGQVLIPSQLLILNTNTFDTIVNAGINPVLRFGNNSIAFTPGIQFTIRRDTEDPYNLNQNLFRQYLYASSSSFFNWLSFSGSLLREAGPFTDQDLHSRDASARLDFVVGRPWGRTSLLTGYFSRDVLFNPLVREYFTTDAYAGVQHRFGNDRVTASLIGEYLRSWRVQDNLYAIAQAIRPGVNVHVRYNDHWTLDAFGILSRGEGDHAYDNFNNQFLVTYVRALQRPLADGTTQVPVSYPLRVSFGVQEQTFYNFTGSGKTTDLLPVVRLSVF